MRLEERKVAVRDLIEGMYVCRLDRDWTDTPFPLQGVEIRSRKDIEALAEYCKHVYVDIELGLAPPEKPERARKWRQYDAQELEKLQGKVAWRDSARFDEELPRAKEAQDQAAELINGLLDNVREGQTIAVDQVRNAVEPMVGSILRNTDAYLWIENLRKRDAYDYSHALNCSALAAVFGRHIGFPEDVLNDLACGGLLLDVGKLRVDRELFTLQRPLGREETTAVQRHVEYGLAIMEEGEGVPAHVRDMVRTHHERDDGSGYPGRVSGMQIPLFGRIAAVIDSYDAMTSDRAHRKAMSRHAALQELYRLRDTRYAAEVVEQFMQCLSVYPTGSLVELSDGCVALVMVQNPARRLRPRVMVLTDPDKQLTVEFRMLDLMDQYDEFGQPSVLIANTLPPGAYGLDPAELYL